ncbi:hypothetical protein BH23ACT9_BH23ACT9_09180 [soil metagenome]
MDAGDVALTARGLLVRTDDRWEPPADTAQALEAATALLEGVQRVPTPSQAFADRVQEYLAPVAGKFNHEAMIHTYMSSERFGRWVSVASAYVEPKGADVLGSGCGVGGSLVEWWSAGAATVTGLEVDPAIVEMAQLRVAGLEGASAQLYDGGDLPFDDGSFDIIESLDVLEHVPWPNRYVSELARVLRPGGAVLLVTPNRLFPVEQHVNVPLATWLPIPVANKVAGRLAPLLRERRPDFSWRLERLHTVRETNVSHRTLRKLAKANGLFLQRIDHTNHPHDWPLPPSPLRADLIATHRLGKFVAPTRHLVTILRKE